MKRVLVTGAANIGKAGVATIVYKWGQQFDSNQIVYDYLMQSGLPEEKYQKAIKDKGGIIYTIQPGTKTLLGIIKWVEEVIRNNNYKILHINSDSAYIATAYIWAAKRAGLKNIYVHSHCTQIDDNNKIKRVIKTIFHKVCMPYVCMNSKKYLACSRLAGEWMFGKNRVASAKYNLIYNGVEAKNYFFSQENRDFYRRQLGIESKIVMSNIGRFSYQKNHEFLIQIFDAFHRKHSDSVLVLVGNGELENNLKEQVKDLGLEEHVYFLGLRKDVPQLLSAFDLLVMPSRFEGLPVTMVEAQMANLPCVVADTITREAKFNELVEYVSTWRVNDWVEKCEKYLYANRADALDNLLESPFNITIASERLATILLGGENGFNNTTSL